MIRITVETEDIHARVNEIYDAASKEARIWRMDDLRRTRNLKLIHKVKKVEGTVRRIRVDELDRLIFECRAKDSIQEAITASRFINFLLRYISSISSILLEPK